MPQINDGLNGPIGLLRWVSLFLATWTRAVAIQLYLRIVDSIHDSPENWDFESDLDSRIDSFINKIRSFWRIVDSRFT